MEQNATNAKRLINAFNSYMDAHNKLSEVWDQFDSGSFSRLYPFEKSFDEVGVDVKIWHDEAVEKLRMLLSTF